MGIDISGLATIRRIGRHESDDCDEEGHYFVGSHRSMLDGLKANSCYVSEGRRFYFYMPYVRFDTWQNALSMIFCGVPAGEVQDAPRRFKGQPFVRLIDFPVSNDVGIGPVTSAELFNEFAQYASQAKRGFQEIAQAHAERKRRGKKTAKPQGYLAKSALSLARAVGGLATGDDDPCDWEANWEVYRNFRRVLKLASTEGLVLVSI